MPGKREAKESKAKLETERMGLTQKRKQQKEKDTRQRQIGEKSMSLSQKVAIDSHILELDRVPPSSRPVSLFSQQ
jgi:hypothetical protein